MTAVLSHSESGGGHDFTEERCRAGEMMGSFSDVLYLRHWRCCLELGSL